MGRVLLFEGLVGLTEAMYLWLVAAGLSLIFGVLRVLNFAHGALYMIGAYLTYAVFRAFGGRLWLAPLIGAVASARPGCSPACSCSAPGSPAWEARCPSRCAPSPRAWES